MSTGELIIYTTEDGLARINLRAVDGTVWLTQNEIADLFDKGRSTVTEHIQNILSEGELDEKRVCRNFRRTADGHKMHNVLHYNLDMILAIGYRVRSTRGTQFRRWANTVLKEYLVKGFAMNDERMKGADDWDYFNEWLERIRDIRTSEKRFYQLDLPKHLCQITQTLTKESQCHGLYISSVLQPLRRDQTDGSIGGPWCGASEWHGSAGAHRAGNLCHL